MGREINKIIVHCSDSSDKLDQGFMEVNQWHKERGFEGWTPDTEENRIYCGYHYIVRRDGTIEIGRPEYVIGAHCYLHNKESIGVCWMGRREISSDQYRALIGLLRVICLKYAINPKRVYGHYEMNQGKTCPNLDMEKLRDMLEFELGGFDGPT